MSWKQTRYRATFFIDSFELYVTYKGQTITCRFCPETGHVQINCEKHARIFKTQSYILQSRNR